MKHKSILRKITATLLSCTLCCTGMTIPEFSADGTEVLPTRFDWREEAPEILTPVKMQYGDTCWAYSFVACLESNLIKKGMADSSLDLSETHLIWFCSGEPAPTDPDDPCCGSLFPYGVKAYTKVPGMGGYEPPLACLAGWQGVVHESDAPPHRDEQPLDESLRYQSIAHLQTADYFDQTDPQEIKTQLMEKGPLRWGYYHSFNNPLSKQGGYYFPDFTMEELKEGKYTGGWHAVVLVGWDDNYAKENFTNEALGDGAWIFRNSWGDYTNSDGGYFYLSYYEPSISSELISHYDFEPVTNYGAVHHYNSSQVRFLTPSDGIGYVTANVFTAEKDEKIAAVGIFTNEPETEYEISVYQLESGFADPENGTLAVQLRGTEKRKGFHTHKLPQSLAVKAGQQYSVVLKTPCGASMFLDSCSNREKTSFYKIYREGEEQLYRDWTDCYAVGTGDICIHVYTEYEGETEDCIYGDLNRDGKVNAVDLSLLKQVLLGSERTDIDRKAADWNEDEAINAEDAKGLHSFLLGIPDQE